MRSPSSFIALFVLLASSTSAGVLGTTLPELSLVDGTHLQNVRIMRASAAQHTVTIGVDRTLRTISLQQIPDELRRRILAECSQADYLRERNIVPSAAAVVRITDASTPAEPPPAPPAPSSQSEPTLADLRQRAAKLAPDELLMYLQKTHQRVSGLDCIIRSTEKIAGWQQIRVSGTASFSMWDRYRDDHVRRVARFEVEFEIVDGEKLRANSVTFDGITGRIDP